MGKALGPMLATDIGNTNVSVGLLPLIDIPEQEPPLIGQNTQDCMASGIYHGMRYEIQGLVAAIKATMGTQTPVLVTGKGSRLFQRKLHPKTGRLRSGWF